MIQSSGEDFQYKTGISIPGGCAGKDGNNQPATKSISRLKDQVS